MTWTAVVVVVVVAVFVVVGWIDPSQSPQTPHVGFGVVVAADAVELAL